MVHSMAREKSRVHYKDHSEKTRVASGRVADLHAFANHKSGQDLFLPGSVRNLLLEPVVDLRDDGRGLVAPSPHRVFQPLGKSWSKGLMFLRWLEIPSHAPREQACQPIESIAFLFASFADTSPYAERGGS